MTHRFLIHLGILACLFASCSKQPSQLAATAKPLSKFQAGQVWAFKTPDGQPNAKLTVLQVEDGGKIGTIVHIAISGVAFGDGQTTISHLPFAESAVEQSVTSLDRESGPVPDFSEGYQLWREAWEAGKGGVFTIPVAEAFDIVTGALQDSQ